MTLICKTMYHSGSGGAMSSNNTECYTLYDVCVELILHTNLTSLSCLSGECINDTGVNDDSTSNDRPSSAEGIYVIIIIIIPLFSESLGGVLMTFLKQQQISFLLTFPNIPPYPMSRDC